MSFDEPVPVPDSIRLQYWDKGVEFLTGGRIFTPPVATSSGTKALNNDFGEEFDETGRMEIGFSEGQHDVSVRVGLDRDYPYIPLGVTAILLAYGSDVPGTNFITYSTVHLGKVKTPITQELKVSSASGSIQSVVLRFEGAGGEFAVEVIDDLTFTTACTDCANEDTAAPAVQIQEPAKDGEPTHNPNMALAFEVTDDVGVASIQVSFLDASAAELASFHVCGAAGAPPCPFPSQTVTYNFTTWAPEHTEMIRVKAWDFTAKHGEAERIIDLVDPGPDMNVWALAMEITQGTQPWVAENPDSRLSGTLPPAFRYPDAPTAVPLVADRTTVVRLYGGVEGIPAGMTLLDARATLRCYTDPTYFMPCAGPPVVYPLDRPPKSLREIELSPDEVLDAKRRDATLSWNFELPGEWTRVGHVYLEARVEAPLGTSECPGCGDAANRIRISRVGFLEVPDFGDLVYVVRIGRSYGGTVTYPTQAQLDPYLDYLRRTFPVDETTVPTTFHGSWLYDQTSDDHSKECGELLPKMGSAYESNMQGRDAVHGFIDPNYPCSGRGGGSIAFTRVNGSPKVAAEETGHEFGLSHAGPPPGHAAECTDKAGGCDSDWPWPHGGIGAFGFDVLNLEVIPKDRPECSMPGACDDGLDNDGDSLVDEECAYLPDGDPPADLMADPHDIMSYGGCRHWVSPRTWIRLYNAFTDSALPYPSTEPQSSTTSAFFAAGFLSTDENAGDPESSDTHLLVRGARGEGGEWSLLPSYEVSLSAVDHEQQGEGEYAIELRDSAGMPLSAKHFSLEPGHIDMDDPSFLIVAPETFSEVLPLPAGVASVVLLQGTEVLAEVVRSPNPPRIQLLSPTTDGFDGPPEEAWIRWSGTDEDGDPLHYMVGYNPIPGAGSETTWQPLAIDWRTGELPVDLTALPGGGDAVVRVLATDGVNTTEVVSPAFAVANKGPHTQILSPLGYASIEEGERIVLRGAASDLEDGVLPADALIWVSDRDGVLGVGRRIGTSRLSPGLHEIELRATDTSGLLGTDLAMVEVSWAPNGQPVADAGPDAVVLPGRTARLSGSGSSDPDGDALTYSWRVVDHTSGMSPVLSGAGLADAALFSETAGTCELELVVHDRQVGSLPDRVVVEFRNRAPVAICVDVRAAADEGCRASASVDGGSYDPDDGDVVWVVEAPAGPYGLGPTAVSLQITDSFDLTDGCTGTVSVEDRTPPDVAEVRADPAVLWPPDGKMQQVSIGVSLGDNCDPAPVCRVVSVSSSEAQNGLGDGNTEPDWEITGDLSVDLRAERSGVGEGRIYAVTARCSDVSGNETVAEAAVVVPHQAK